MSETATEVVKLTPTTKKRLEELRIVRRETLDEVVARLIDAATSERREAQRAS